jgi:hypothetical protein
MKSCYDRIVHAVASPCLQQQGISKSEVVCMFSTLQNLEHTIRTAYGDSEDTYGGDMWVIPMQGVYQGNGAGPLNWAVGSSLLLDIMREEGFGIFYQTSLSAQVIRFVGYAFVDDTDLVQTGKDGSETGLEILEQMQAGVNLWEGIIDATGGALSVKKSRWWLRHRRNSRSFFRTCLVFCRSPQYILYDDRQKYFKTQRSTSTANLVTCTKLQTSFQ